MKVTARIGVVCIAMCLAGCARLDHGRKPQVGQHPQAFEATITKTVGARYWLYLPAAYGQDKNKRWPMILFLHGAGERGDNLKKVKTHGPPKLVEQRDFPFVVVSPQCPGGEWWDSDTLIALVDKTVADYRIDPDRVYLTGLSMGGYGTWQLAFDYPDRFAAIAPICGSAMWLLAHKIKHIPCWVFHGAKDRVVPLEASEKMVAALKKEGADVKFTVYPDAGHDSWTETYNNPELYDWFLQHKRNRTE